MLNIFLLYHRIAMRRLWIIWENHLHEYNQSNYYTAKKYCNKDIKNWFYIVVGRPLYCIILKLNIKMIDQFFLKYFHWNFLNNLSSIHNMFVYIVFIFCVFCPIIGTSSHTACGFDKRLIANLTAVLYWYLKLLFTI